MEVSLAKAGCDAFSRRQRRLSPPDIGWASLRQDRPVLRWHERTLEVTRQIDFAWAAFTAGPPTRRARPGLPPPTRAPPATLPRHPPRPQPRSAHPPPNRDTHPLR